MSDVQMSDRQQHADRVKVGHLVSGVFLLGVAATWALYTGGAIDGLATGVVLPVLLVAAGVVGLVAMVIQSRRTPRSIDNPQEEQS